MILALLLAAMLVYTPNALHIPLQTGITGVNVANGLFALAVLALWLRRGSDGVGASLKAPLIAWFCVLAIGLLLAFARGGADPMSDYTYFKEAVFYPLFYFVFLHGPRELATTRRLLWLLLAVAVVAGAEAWREAFDYGFSSYQLSHRSAGPFGIDYRSANRAGVFFAMFLPLLLAVALFAKGRPFLRLAAFVGTFVLAGAVLFTYSRQSWLIAIIVCLLTLLRRSVLLAIAASIAFALAVPYLPSGVSERVDETTTVGQFGEERYDRSTESRWEIWEGAAAMWRENPMGVGLDRFKGEIGHYSTYAGYDAHNFYVLTLAELGFLGLIALVWVVIALARLARRMGHAVMDGESAALAVGFSGTVAAMALSNVYGSPFVDGTVMGCFWALCGLVERYRGLRLAQPESTPAAPPVPAHVIHPGWAGLRPGAP